MSWAKHFLQDYLCTETEIACAIAQAYLSHCLADIVGNVMPQLKWKHARLLYEYFSFTLSYLRIPHNAQANLCLQLSAVVYSLCTSTENTLKTNCITRGPEHILRMSISKCLMFP